MSCVICHECYTDNNSFSTPCDHTFHKECLKTWFNTQSANNRTQTCPLCRRELINVLNDMPEQTRYDYIENAMRNDIIINEIHAVLAVGLVEQFYRTFNLQNHIGLNLRGLTSNFIQNLENNRNDSLINNLCSLISCAVQTDKNNKRR